MCAGASPGPITSNEWWIARFAISSLSTTKRAVSRAVSRSNQDPTQAATMPPPNAATMTARTVKTASVTAAYDGPRRRANSDDRSALRERGPMPRPTRAGAAHERLPKSRSPRSRHGYGGAVAGLRGGVEAAGIEPASAVAPPERLQA